VEVREVAVALAQIEPVADEELVRHGEADVADWDVLDKPPVGPVEQRDCGERRGVAQRQRLAEVVERQPGIHDVLDDEDVAAGDLGVEVLEEADPRVAARVGVGAVRGELDEVQPVRDPERPGEVGDEDDARLQRCDEQRLAAVVLGGDLAAELADAPPELLAGKVDLADGVART
jgi:hypothetical protein